MAELQKALKVVQTTMKHRGAKLLFNQKVDPVALGLHDYFKIVKHPMDLGTICDRLSAAEYSSPSQVTLLIDEALQSYLAALQRAALARPTLWQASG